MDKGYYAGLASVPHGRPHHGTNNADLRQRFLADQQIYTTLGYLPQHGQPGIAAVPQMPMMSVAYQAQPAPAAAVPVSHQQYAVRGYQPGPAAGAPGPAQVGWGGQAIQDATGYRVPWFGRNRGKHPRQRGSGKDEPRGSRGWEAGYTGAGPASANLARPAEDAMTVEEIVSFIQKLSKREHIPDKVFRALYHLDSRAVALLLKDLSRVGLDKRAVEVFEYLRGLDTRHPLRQLCDVYTYTAMISLCIYQQDVDRAQQLVDDMRQNNVERNVHTYTALMNVCIKCGQLQRALDIYNRDMRANHCVPNVVTYNTLIDVYGKLGQWDKAVQVIDIMKNDGVEPVLRTYNTLIIACNMCSQAREALGVYHRLLSDGFTPNSTTFNALISAYGKTSQLDKALEIYQEMLRQNMDRSVITYSSLISACEKAGQWETALKIFAEMQQDGCAPNTVTFNSLITACAQGGQWQKASEVFEQMAAQGCTPDVVTYTALISAYEKGGQWRKALQAFHNMCLQGCKPDNIIYNAIIDTLWETGIVWAQSKALQLYLTALKQGQFMQEPVVRKPGRVVLNLHAYTAGVAMVSLYCWLQDIKRVVVEKGPEYLPASLAILTDQGKTSKEQGNCIVKEAVQSMMAFWEAPFRLVPDAMYAALLEAPSHAVAEWVLSDTFSAQVASLFPISGEKVSEETFNSREQQVTQNCNEAFSAVEHFEHTHSLNLSNMSPNYMQQRSVLISHLLDISGKLGLRDEVVHDAVLLMDRTASQAKQVTEDLLLLVGVAALVIASKQGESSDRLPTNLDIERVTDFPATSVAKMEWNIRGLLADDTAAISTMRCLKIYLERLGYRFLDKQGVYGMAGFAIMLAVDSLYDPALLNCRPSVVAAALIYSERRLRGAVPFWPSMLGRLTGIDDMNNQELHVACRIAQKLSRKAVYAQMYKQQLVTMSMPGAAQPGAIPDLLQPLPAEWQQSPGPQGQVNSQQGSGRHGEELGAVPQQPEAESIAALTQAMQALTGGQGLAGKSVAAGVSDTPAGGGLALVSSSPRSAGAPVTGNWGPVGKRQGDDKDQSAEGK